jgi:hypothetical protein
LVNVAEATPKPRRLFERMPTRPAVSMSAKFGLPHWIPDADRLPSPTAT